MPSTPIGSAGSQMAPPKISNAEHSTSSSFSPLLHNGTHSIFRTAVHLRNSAIEINEVLLAHIYSFCSTQRCLANKS
jgi:hypothetical protein